MPALHGQTGSAAERPMGQTRRPRQRIALCLAGMLGPAAGLAAFLRPLRGYGGPKRRSPSRAAFADPVQGRSSSNPFAPVEPARVAGVRRTIAGGWPRLEAHP